MGGHKVRPLCSLRRGQRLVEDTDSVGEEGGGKFSSSSTATPTLLRRVNMQDAATHLLVLGLYFSMELRLELPSLPPTAYSQPSIATRSWVLLGAGQVGISPWGGARGGGVRGGHRRSPRGGVMGPWEEPRGWGRLEPLGRRTDQKESMGGGHAMQG